MKLKQAILQVLDRDGLKAVADGLEIEVADRRSATELAATLSRSHRATPEAMLEYLSESAVKAVCDVYGTPSIGRRGKLIRLLLRTAPKASKDGQASKNNRPRKVRTTHGRGSPAKENKSMSADETTQDTQEPVTRLPEPPPGMLRVARTEVVWPGKYNEDGTLREAPRVSLPFQVIERVNESRATREAKKAKGPTLFDIWEHREGDTFETGWRNKLIWGDNLLVAGSLLEQFAGKVDLVYIDPPFATGADFSFRTFVGDEELLKEPSLIEEKAYRDTWGRGLDSFLQMLFERFQVLRDLLSNTGTLYVHIGWEVSHYVKAALDHVFGSGQLINQIIWKRQTAHSDSRQGSTHFGRVHDCIFRYAKSDTYTWNQLYTPYDDKYMESHYRNVEPKTGRRYELDNMIAPGGASKGNPYYEFLGVTKYWRYSKLRMQQLYDEGRVVQPSPGAVPRYKRYLDEMPGVPAQDVWTDINAINSQAIEAVGYPTQKPVKLLERIISASSNPGDLVLDCFCGAGTTLAVAESLNRRWIGCDLSRWALHVSRKRMLGIEGSKPFEILNLGKYERQYWQGVTFGQGKDKTITEHALYEYLAFVLRLYGAQPVAGLAHLHGKKGRAMVHIGAVDAPVTIEEIGLALDECVRIKQPELHVLGWEWEMGLAGPNNEYRKGGLMQDEARKRGVKLILRQIPRELMEEQAVEKGDIEFFELAYLEVEIKQPKKVTAHVALKDFVIPNTFLLRNG